MDNNRTMVPGQA